MLNSAEVISHSTLHSEFLTSATLLSLFLSTLKISIYLFDYRWFKKLLNYFGHFFIKQEIYRKSLA